MTALPPRRPWWKKKRWAAAFALLLVVAYPLSFGPVKYSEVREWLPAVSHAVYLPAVIAISGTPLAVAHTIDTSNGGG